MPLISKCIAHFILTLFFVSQNDDVSLFEIVISKYYKIVIVYKNIDQILFMTECTMNLKIEIFTMTS